MMTLIGVAGGVAGLVAGMLLRPVAEKIVWDIRDERSRRTEWGGGLDADTDAHRILEGVTTPKPTVCLSAPRGTTYLSKHAGTKNGQLIVWNGGLSGRGPSEAKSVRSGGRGMRKMPETGILASIEST